MISSNWEPPFSCQRCTIRSSHLSKNEEICRRFIVPQDEVIFFPFELDDVDYFHRVVGHLTRHLIYSAIVVSSMVGIADVSLGNKSFIDSQGNTLRGDNENSESNSVRRLLQVLVSRIAPSGDSYNAKSGSLQYHQQEQLTPGHVLHYVYLCNPTGSEASSMDSDENLYTSADDILAYYDQCLLIPIPKFKNSSVGNDTIGATSRDAKILPDRAKLFDAAGAFIKGITEYMVRHYYPDLSRGVSSQSPLGARITLTPPPSTPLVAVLSDTASKLRELDERIHLHSTFRQQRIKYLGWTSNSQPAAMPAYNGELSNESKIAAARDPDGEAGYNSATAALLREYNDVKEQILQIISAAEARAYVHLIYRLAYVSRALNQNVVLWHADRGEYTEAQRLRNLSNAIQATFYEQCAGSNDNDNIMNRVQSISRDSTLVSSELERLSEKTRNMTESLGSNSYSTAQSLAVAAKDLQMLNFALQGFTNCSSRYEFLDSPKQSKDTDVITSDAIFLSTPTLTTNGDNELNKSLKSVAVLQQMSISALIVASGATSVLASIQSSWPEFSALRNNNQGANSPAPSEVSLSPRPASPAASYLSNATRNSHNSARNTREPSVPIRPQPTGKLVPQNSSVKTSRLRTHSDSNLHRSLASSMPVGALVNDERTISLEYGYAADEEYHQDTLDNNMESSEFVGNIDDEWTKYLSSTAAMSLGETGLRNSWNGQAAAVSSTFSPVPFNDSSPRPQQSYELQTEAGSRSSRYNNLNTYMDSMAVDSPEESVADDYANNNSFVNNAKSNSFRSSGHTSISKQLQQPPQEPFSMVIYNLLVSFEDLQKQLIALLTPQSLALNALLCRLIGVQNNLSTLIEVNMQAGQYSEADRLRHFAHIIDLTIDADLEDEDTNSSINTSINSMSRSEVHFSQGNNTTNYGFDESGAGATVQLLCGRGRRRIDNCSVVVEQVRQAVRELQRLTVKAKTYRDFTGAQALDAMAGELRQQLESLEASLQIFNLLSSGSEGENEVLIVSTKVMSPTSSTTAPNSPDGVYMNINEKIARSGTRFITSDFIFQYNNVRSNGHSIGSLAVVCGAGAILRFIRAKWPNFTALNNKSPKSNRSQPTKLSLDTTVKSDDQLNQSQSDGLSFKRINFRDANELRQLGFDPGSLRSAGFSDMDILTGGFTADQLRSSGFGSVNTYRASGLTDAALRIFNVSIGHKEEQLVDFLSTFFIQSDGVNWKESKGWRELKKVTLTGALNGRPPNAEVYSKVLSSLFGVRFDFATIEIKKINLPFNNLRGTLIENIGFLSGLTQLCLSENSLRGPIPSSIGLLVHLDTLLLDHNSLEGEIPKSLKNLANLVVLRLENNKLSGCIPVQLCQLQFLKRLDLSNNILSGSIPERIGELNNLQELLLGNNRLCGNIPDSITNLHNLTSLLLNANLFAGNIPKGIEDLRKLTSFNIQDNQNIQVNKIWLQKSLPKCRVKV